MHTRFTARLPQRRTPRRTALLTALTLAGLVLHGAESSAGSNPDTSGKPLQRAAVLDAPSQPPAFGKWERQMTAAGERLGKALRDQTAFTTRLKLQYYDAQRVYEQIAHYLGKEQPWREFADAAEDVYKEYLERADFRAAGYMRFPHGLYLDWERNGDSQSREYLKRLRDRPAFSDPAQSGGEWRKQKYSREIAYSLQTQILAHRAGHKGDRKRIDALANLALGHVDIWVKRKYIDKAKNWQFCQAFMGGLTASALIDYYEYTAESGKPDQRVLAAVRRLADFLWDTMWVSNVDGTGYGAFEYVQPATSGVGSNAPAPDLNLLIAPMYAWLYLQTGNAVYLDRGDDIFAGGVELSDVNAGKRFNQNYRASFRYLSWRTAAVAHYQ